MMNIKVNDLKVYNYNVNLDIDYHEIIGIFSRDKTLTFEFLKLLAGINQNNNSIMYNEKDVFDNKEYFSKRILLDYSKKYLSTIKTRIIKDSIKNKYDIEFNKDIFTKLINKLNIRREVEINQSYDFTSAGITYVNFALSNALEKENLLIMNPTINIDDINNLETIVKGIADKSNFKSVILGLDNLSVFKNLLSKIIIFGDFDRVHVLDSKSTLLVSSYDLNSDKLIFDGTVKIYSNNFSKDEHKTFIKNKIKYSIVSMYELESYLGK